MPNDENEAGERNGACLARANRNCFSPVFRNGLLRRGHLRKTSETAAAALLTLGHFWKILRPPKYLFCF